MAATPDPELPHVTIAELGILREVAEAEGEVVVTITPTYSGCPAMREIGADITARLHRAGHDRVRVRTALSPAWTTEWITETGRRKLAAACIPPPTPVHRRGPVALTLTPRPVTCPRCGSTDTAELARFSATACKSLHRCRGCAEPFEAVKPL